MKIRVLLAFLFCLFSYFGQAQTLDTLAGKSYRELSSIAKETFKSDFNKAEKVAQYYLKKAKKENNLREEFIGLNFLINYRIYQRKFDEFVYEKERLLSISESLDNKSELMFTYYSFGNSYFFQGVWKESIDAYTKVLDLSKEIGNKGMEMAVLSQLGYIKSTIGDYNGAIGNQKQALILSADEEKDSIKNQARLRSRIAALYYVSLTYLKTKQKDSAKHYIDRALLLNKKIKDTCLDKSLYRTLGFVNVLSNDFKKALVSFDTSKNICLPLNKGEELVLSAGYGKVYIGQKKYAEAVEILEKGLKNYGVKPEEEGFMEEHYKLLAKAYKYSDSIEKSNFYFEKYIHTTDEFKKIQDDVISKFKEEELKDFEAELEAINYKKNSFKYITWIATGLVILLLIILYQFYKKKKGNSKHFETLVGKTSIDDKNEEVTSSEEESGKDVAEDIRAQILQGLKKLEAKEYFLQQECNSYNVAKKIKTNTSYLSKVINSHYQKNFNTYINDLRINYAVLRLKNNKQFRQYSIQSIAEEVGYKSADSFTRYFKKHTGLNPSFYIKKLNDQS